MINSMMKFRILFVLALMLQLISVPLYSSAETDLTAATPMDYLALGDSLAAGVNSGNQLGDGYTDYLAQTLKANDLLKTFNKKFAVPGYTSSQVLADLEKDEVKQAVTNTDLITISVGANDTLTHIKFDAETGEATIDDLPALMATIQQVGANYSLMLKEIYAINPEAQVYIMGYYNPFPHIPNPSLQAQLGQLLGGLNGAIQQGMTGTKAVFVPTADKIAENYATYLPNPSNIHLSEAGYKVVAEQFAMQMGITPPITKDTFPDIATSEFKDFIEQAVALGLINGYTDGTFKPGNNLTRVQAASIIVRALKLEANEAAPFPDITSYDKKTQAEIAAAYQFRIVKGSDGKFNPSKPITRAQLALMIKRTYEQVTGQPYTASKTAPFVDINHLDDETKNAISMLYTFEIANGSNGAFMPSKPTTRGQAAKIFVNTTLVLDGLQ